MLLPFEGDATGKRRKTVWAAKYSQSKTLGPIQLSEFKKGFVAGSHEQLERKELKAKLIEINRKLQQPELHDNRPEKERSPSPQPVYNNLGIRINTRALAVPKETHPRTSMYRFKLDSEEPHISTST